MSITSVGPHEHTEESVKQNSARTLSDEELRKIHAYWRACNYLAAGMIYLRDNPLLREPLQKDHIKSRLLGHWGASPALSFTYIHLNRLIRKYDLDAIFIAGPGHGAPGVLGPVYLEGTYSEIFPKKSEDVLGMKSFFKEFSLFPGGNWKPLHARASRDPSTREEEPGLQHLAWIRRGLHWTILGKGSGTLTVDRMTARCTGDGRRI